MIGLFNRPKPNHRHNGKECCSVVSSRFFGGALRDIPKTAAEETSLARALERLSFTLTFTANGKNKTFAVCLQLSVQ